MSDFQELLTEFRIAAMEKGDEGGPLDHMLYERMNSAYRKLRSLGEPARKAFVGLLEDPAPTVRGWVAAALLSQGDKRALPVLRALSNQESVAGFNALMTLREYEKGTLTGPFGGSAA
jgi:hypothetical protein